jgi:hypothetical protein
MWTRVPGFAASQLDAALYESRSLWRLHAMRRTLFVVAAADAGMFEAGATRQIAEKERARVIGWLRADMTEPAAGALLQDLASQVLTALDGTERWTADLAEAIPELQRELRVGAGKWAGVTPLSSRLLYLMAMEGLVVRARPAGSWRSSQYAWAAAHDWFARPMDRLEPAEGRGLLLERYLASYGPVTMTDVRWWTGWTVAQVREALAAAGAVAAEVDGGEAFVGPDYRESEPESGVVSLLPGLDSSAMGWKERDWYIHPEYVPALFDRNGNIGPTVWLDGRIIGGWAQTPTGAVSFRLLESVDSEAAARVETECRLLETWLGETSITPRFRTPLERALAGRG